MSLTVLCDKKHALQKTLARVAERAASGEFGYNKFFAIGLFRLLEVSGH